ncbi:hypothetical protein M8J75_013652 [Diaphorina citri]|nr:hypothetical protein M8J75_013652 [Diaphorina citri]
MIAMQNLWKADFAKFTATLGGKLDEYEKSLEFTAGKMDDIAKDIKVIQQKMIETEQKQNKIEAENKELKTRVRNLEVELKEMAQAALNNKLEISGLPNSANLNVTDVAKKFVEKTGLDPIAVGNYTVEKPFKTQNQDRPNVKASIVVGFKSVETRNQVFDHWFIGCQVTKNGAPLPQEEKKTTIIKTVNSRKVQQEIELMSWENFKHIKDPEEMYRSIEKVLKEKKI